jgi:hypothetical protein
LALSDVQAESQNLFEGLLRARGGVPQPGLAPPGAEDTAPAARGRFSTFDEEQAAVAGALALGLAVVAAEAPSRDEGLEAALDTARRAAGTEDPELVHHALSLFATHSREGRLLRKPRSVTAAPRLFAPSSLAVETAAEPEPGGSTGVERPLDYWREDPLANEHHEHWHEVYPWSGLFPTDFVRWAEEADRNGLLELFTLFDPNRDWASFLQSATPDAVAREFISRANALIRPVFRRWVEYLGGLSARAYGTLFRLNDRQGEIFFYMHEQMLARYEAERLSLGLPALVPLDDFTAPIPEEYDPGPALREFEGFRKRVAGRTIASADSQQLATWREAVETAVDGGSFIGSAGSVEITRTNIGENVEGAERRLRPQMSAAAYPGTHNPGHMFISDLSEENDEGERVGVMAIPRTAIRDPIFWRWHKYIDDLNFLWQETRPKQTRAEFEQDAPPVVLRDSIGGGATPWASPDVILCRTADLPGHDAPGFVDAGGRELGEQAFGGDAWDRDFADAEVELPDGTAFRTTATLATEVKEREFVVEPPPDMPGPPISSRIQYLTHEPFCWFLRLENVSDRDVDVTVRIFIASEDTQDDPAHERRAWIELDKFTQAVPAGQRIVAFRPDVLSAVIKKPADVDPANPVEPEPGGEDDGGSYCQCGWPYSLLLPRGTEDGLAFRALVLLTDATADSVPRPGGCGSMSFCGAVDRYPDSRDMGYPFARPFEQPLAETLLPLGNAAGRRLQIKLALA